MLCKRKKNRIFDSEVDKYIKGLFCCFMLLRGKFRVKLFQFYKVNGLGSFGFIVKVSFFVVGG